MVSVDTPEDNKAFALKEHADFPMLSNPDKKVAFAYQVIAPDAPPERQFARRYTYYIDPTGKIASIDKTVKPASSGQDIVTHLTELKVGDAAPDFTLPGTDSKTYTLKDLKGHWVVLGWFPKAFTAG